MTEKETLYLTEFKHNVEHQDIIKGLVILNELPEMLPDTRLKVLAVLQDSPQSYYLLLLSEFFALKTDDLSQHPELVELTKENLRKRPEQANWFPSKTACTLLLQLLDEVEDEAKMAELILTLGEIEAIDAVNPLSEYLYSGSWILTKNSIYSLGQIGTKHAVLHLISRLGSDEKVDICILEALAKTGKQRAYKALTDYLGSPNASSRTRAKELLVDLGKLALPFLYENLTRSDPDILIHTLNVLGSIGDSQAAKPIRQFLVKSSGNANVRFAAYEALGYIKMPGGSFVLATGLEDEDIGVRTASAKAIDRNFDMILDQGIRNMLRAQDEASRELIKIFIDAESLKVVSALTDCPFFKKNALEYLEKHAHREIKQQFLPYLKEHLGENHPALQDLMVETEKPASKLTIWAVDDSRMILRMYRSMLHDLGYDSVNFEFPKQLCERIQSERPHIIFTDLNMPKITGIELAKFVRKRHSQEDLPIIMATTQTENEDHIEAVKAGINMIIKKPFTKKLLQESIDKVS
ncbi:MAG: hypothetical protein CSA81_04540 [Acidobacteria bacterium]|nr:MAG: hypothetical protein CSA81_04540 [Acidobacteriota bacterium]